MPGRTAPIVTNKIYHVFNRGIASQPTFLEKRNYDRALESLFYYQNCNLPIKYSKFLSLSVKERTKILEDLSKKNDRMVEIISYCLMPNHFHLLLRQVKDNGISKVLGDFTNSYTRYINTKLERTGPIFSGKFKSVRIETEYQLIHVSRYIHLNPYTAYLVRDIEGLINYPYSSFPEFLGKTNFNHCSKDVILSEFKNVEHYKKFVTDQKDYQRELDRIKHLALEK
jgi:putative transposase